ncbi:MAG TPA: hypothetical protein VK465_08845, partial [Fibrobacteria bacterium]|nr:hypothetical protein [Fibrobacteria bacterium]
MAITSTHPLPQLAPVYLMTGYLDPERTKGGQAYPKSGTLLPVADRYFSYLTHTHEETLIATDGKGLLRSFDSKLEPLQPKQHLNQQPLKLNVLPQGLVRQAFFANLADWQKVLVDEIRKAKLAHAYKTLPFRFEKKDLRTPEEDDEVGREAHSGFKEGMKYFGQLFPRVQAVLFLVPAGILSGGKVKATLRKDGNVVTTFTEDGNGLKRTFEKKNSLTYALESAEYVCYSHASTDGSLAEGFYTLEIPGSALRKERFPSDSPILTGGLRFGCDVKFSLRTLYGDFDYHVLNLVSVESALLSNFPDTFVHLQKSLFTPAAPGGTAPGGGSAGEDG